MVEVVVVAGIVTAVAVAVVGRLTDIVPAACELTVCAFIWVPSYVVCISIHYTIFFPMSLFLIFIIGT